jgi:RNA binding exosome subunit
VEDLWRSAKEIVEKKTTFFVRLDFQVITQISNQINGGDK